LPEGAGGEAELELLSGVVPVARGTLCGTLRGWKKRKEGRRLAPSPVNVLERHWFLALIDQLRVRKTLERGHAATGASAAAVGSAARVGGRRHFRSARAAHASATCWLRDEGALACFAGGLAGTPWRHAPFPAARTNDGSAISILDWTPARWVG